MSGERARRRRQRFQRGLVVDRDDAAQGLEDRPGELIPWVDRGEAGAPGDCGQRDRAHDDIGLPHQGVKSADRDAGHDADDRLLCPEGQV